MTQSLLHRIDWDAPAVTKLPGLLLDAVIVRDATHYLQTVGMFETFNSVVNWNSADLPCPVTHLAAPVLTDPVAASAGGTLGASVAYLYKITATNLRGETIASNEATGTTTGVNKTLTPTWAAVTGAENYHVYRTAAAGPTNTEVYLATVTAPTVSYTDTGAATPGTAVPPTTNTADVYTPKVMGHSEWIDGSSFATYLGATCKSVGYELDNAYTELRRVFGLVESVGVEDVLMAGPLSTGANDLTPGGGAVSPEVGIALLEGDFAQESYTGVPTLHVPRTIASLLTVRDIGISRDGDRYFTPLGSKLVAGAGYGVHGNIGPTGAAPAAGELWLYASGEVTVGQGEIIQRQELDRTTNDVVAIVERPYIVTFDGAYRAAVRVEIA